MKKIKFLVASILVSTFVVSGSTIKAAPADGQNNMSKFNKGNLSEQLPKDMNGVNKFLNDNKSKMGIENPQDEVIKLSEKQDSLSFKHIKVQQTVKGIPVYGNEYIIHFNKDGKVYATNGKIDPAAKKAKINKNEFISGDKAVQIAKSQVKFNKLEMTPSSKLYLYKVSNDYTPVYEVRVNFIDPSANDWHFFIDAYSGKVVDKYNSLSQTTASGSGMGVLGDTKKLTLDKVGSQYQMKDTTRPAVITTYNSGNTNKEPGNLIVSNTNVIKDKAAVDAHYYAGVVYDYYKTKFNRNGIDNNNMAMKSSVHYREDPSQGWVNAAWTGNQMIYGDGDGVTALPLSGSLDVIGHEMTHGVDQFEANLTYRNQSGALNESFSDVFGTFIEFYAQPSQADWLAGEDVWTPNKSGDALRSLENPTLYGQPDNMKNYKYTSSDNGGVHTNSGIPNKAAYLIATNPKVGIAKAEQIYYRALCNYLTSSASFSDAKTALAQSAEDLYGANSPEYNAVITAWNSVGL